ncbi:ATP-binding cassette domain-containing protein [Actinorugispora endophytica]|uniref:ABC transporter family protein n=1 Tax=Actinorugispora endophytica TaxID=1605990 RepID=A0A4R6V4K0_9ACTN|nr:ATP-binding cassette domain-containing protein [Actinorugispora endophytica]TDQ55123.1 ABC transporter family protein [Actinorugispora endophytica]
MLLERVGKRYHPRAPWVLRDIDLHLPESSLVRISGGNGGGKSTLLRLLAGVSAPTAGSVRNRPRTAYVPERFPPALPFDAARYLRHLGRVHGLGAAEAARRADHWTERLGLGDHARSPLRQLSKGTSQKVAVAQALMAEPGLLVLDEAWTGLDAGSRAVLDAAVLDRVAAGGRAVFVDHDPRRLAGRVDAAYAVTGTGLRPVGTAPAPPPGARVLIEVDGLGPEPLPALPGSPEVTPATSGRTRLTVSEHHSDALLRALLDLPSAPHVRAVRGATDPGESA